MLEPPTALLAPTHVMPSTEIISASMWSKKLASPQMKLSHSSFGELASSPRMKGCFPPLVVNSRSVTKAWFEPAKPNPHSRYPASSNTSTQSRIMSLPVSCALLVSVPSGFVQKDTGRLSAWLLTATTTPAVLPRGLRSEGRAGDAVASQPCFLKN